jgi:hypothetical protein
VFAYSTIPMAEIASLSRTVKFRRTSAPACGVFVARAAGYGFHTQEG